MTILVYEPAITVTLFKMIKRVNGVAQRYAGLRRQIDLTPFLGEGGVVRTSKSLGAPAGGFTISIPDQPDTVSGDTVYALVEPMDMIEIRMARQPEKYAGAKLPLVMRGFASTITRAEAMGADGAPERFVVIAGQDFGKFLTINAIYWRAIYFTDPEIISFWQVGAAAGMAPAIYSAGDFVSGMVAAFNKKIAGLPAFAAPASVQPFSTDISVTQGYTLPCQQAAIGEGTYWSILTAFADLPWNEIFIQDLEAGPQVVYRPVPYLDINGKWIGGAKDPGSFRIDISEIVSLSMSRTDDQVANIFWVDPTNIVMGSAGGITAGTLPAGTDLDFSHQNDDPNLFGQKIMKAQTNLYADMASAVAGASGSESASNSGQIGWWQNRTDILKLINRDNSVWESGSVLAMGREDFQIGKYLKVTRGSLESTAYMTQVDHTFVVYQSWTTNIQLIRGDGFIVRNQYVGNPFWAEGRHSPYDS
jgi:hypothetical protein